MFLIHDKYVFGMAVIRIISSMIELAAALLMLKLGRVDRALQINAALAFIGPIILMAVMAMGLMGLAGKIEPSRLLIIGVGVALIFLGILKK